MHKGRFLLLSSLLCSVASAAVWHVAPAPTGSDSSDGSAQTPFATIGKAATVVGDWDDGCYVAPDLGLQIIVR